MKVNHREVLYNILIESGIPILVQLIKMCLNEIYSRDWTGKHFSDIFPIKNGWNKMLYDHYFSTLLLAYAIRVQVNPEGLKLNGTYRLVYADDVNILDKSVHFI
jgi:hypothetical protein